MKNLMKIQLIAFVGALILSACSTSNDVVSNNFITKRKHNKGFHIDFNRKYDTEKGCDLAKEEKIKSTNIVESVVDNNSEKSIAVASSDGLTSDKLVSEELSENAAQYLVENNASKDIAEFSTFRNEKILTKAIKREQKSIAKHTIKTLKKEIKTNQKDDVDTILLVILCFILPPLAVYLHQGEWNKKCWINLFLTILCGLPGIIHALITVLK